MRYIFDAHNLRQVLAILKVVNPARSHDTEEAFRHYVSRLLMTAGEDKGPMLSGYLETCGWCAVPFRMRPDDDLEVMHVKLTLSAYGVAQHLGVNPQY